MGVEIGQPTSQMLERWVVATAQAVKLQNEGEWYEAGLTVIRTLREGPAAVLTVCQSLSFMAQTAVKSMVMRRMGEEPPEVMWGFQVVDEDGEALDVDHPGEEEPRVWAARYVSAQLNGDHDMQAVLFERLQTGAWSLLVRSVSALFAMTTDFVREQAASAT